MKLLDQFGHGPYPRGAECALPAHYLELQALCDALGRKPAYLLAMTGVVSAGMIFFLRSPALMPPLAIYSGLMAGLGTVAGLSYVMDATPRQTLALATGS